MRLSNSFGLLGFELRKKELKLLFKKNQSRVDAAFLGEKL